ncbi:MAG: glutamine--fructose-6-phosphate transaminase (isomerizing) [Candidatus Nanohaloarchaea archaeon]
MCGIVGYHGEDEAAEKVFRGLKKLEYRGYDSAGIATAGNPSVKVEKGVGTIDEVTQPELDGSSGIGHTRWATHGEVNQTNAHPHMDCEERIAVVHNGIINNYESLKEELEGHSFRSETDTEVIPHLLERELEKSDSLKEAAQRTMDALEGSYAVVAVLDSGELVAFRQGSPLSLGLAGDEIFLASDVTPFLEHTDRAVFLEDGDLVVIDDGHEIYNSGEPVERETTEIEWDAEEASKEGHDHFMQKEIKEQPKTVKRAAFQDESDLREAVEMMDDADRIYVTGCGTSSYAASLGAKYLRKAGYDVVTEQSHELEYRADEISEDDLVIAISQSGETADLLSMLEETEAPLLSLVNVVGSTLARDSDHVIYVNAGPEIAVASTKAFTAQLTVLNLLKYAAEGRIDEGRDALLRTAERIPGTLEDNEETLEEISDYFAGQEHVYFIGRHKGVEIAREASLKLKEVSYVHSEAFPGGEFKHGTIALVEEGTPVVAFMKDTGFEEIYSNAKEAESRGAEIIAVGPRRVDDFDHHVEIPNDRNPEILEGVVFQMAAYLTAVKKGNNPDKPRNLAKSVTVK